MALVGIGALMTACSTIPENKYEWLSFFFDGVPDPNAVDSQAETVQVGHSAIVELGAGYSTQPISTVTIHEPYEKRNCQSCHESAFSQNLLVARNELCFTCHFEGGIRETLTHAPVLSGDCWVCHDPHQSNSKFLLTREEPEMCLQCHDGVTMDIPAGHSNVPEINMNSCSQCHDPHGNNNDAYLRPFSQPGTL
jgi:predicted CXXCH cytochrome family protein